MRIAFTIVTFVFILIAPFWVYLPLISLGIIVFPLYLEAIALAVFADILYGELLFTFLSAIFVLFAIPLREHLRFQSYA